MLNRILAHSKILNIYIRKNPTIPFYRLSGKNRTDVVHKSDYIVIFFGIYGIPQVKLPIFRKKLRYSQKFSKKQNSMITQDQLKETEERKLALRRYL